MRIGKRLVVVMLLIAAVCIVSGCGKKSGINEKLDTSKDITISIGGGWQDVKALEELSQKFNEKYPNCTVEYEYIQDYVENLQTRLEGDVDKLDIFFTTNIQRESPMVACASELYSLGDELKLTDTYEGLIKNFEYMNESADAKKAIYAIPTGGELRGMFVNKTLLDSLDIEMPSNNQEFLAACGKLKENGYVPLHGNPGTFAQQFLYPYVCNLVVNGGDYDNQYKKINELDEGISEFFKAPMAFMYDVVSNKYYDYKTVENDLGMFVDTSYEGVSKDFLNILPDGNGGYVKKDDVGQVAFLPAPMTMDGDISKVKDDYHSEIEYEFILSPVGEDGGYAYMSPAQGLAINNNSDNMDWSVEFLNFFFEEENNKQFAEEFGIIPNTSDALDYISDKFDIKDNQISQLGQMTFDYGFYNVISKSLLEVSKANNPKYMKEDGTMYDLQYYMDRMETRFEEIRTGESILGED